MKFVVNNPLQFERNSEVHGYNTRRKNDIHYSSLKLTLAQRGVNNAATKIFDHLPNDIKCLTDSKVKFESSLKKFLLDNSFYSIEEFLLR